ncbi:MAG TPA: protein kinase [Burkholderiales bacterium]|nr:protein kinase [Burkholderiales bacterium]
MTESPDPDRTVMVPAAAAADSSRGGPLAVGTRMGEFEIVGLIGEGGFGVVYLAKDHSLERTVALKEYMPFDLARRTTGGGVAVRSERHAETFDAGMRSFVNEARLLAQFNHPSLVKVYRFWEGNGTAYMVMPFYEGATLKQLLATLPEPPDEAWLKHVLSQVLDALEVMHAQHCYHRDIAPDNILMLSGDTPVLLDFGAARRVIGDSSSLTVILKPGYAPIEQYAEDPSLQQGPWTDLYALASVVHFAIMGRPPVPSVGRAMADPQVPLVQAAAGRYSEAFLSGLDAALSVRPFDRPVNIAEFRDALGFGPLQNHPALREHGAPRGTTQRTGGPTTVPTSTATRAPVTGPASQAGVGAANAAITLDRAQLEKLLARYIGPLARIIIGRAAKTARSDQALLQALSEAIDDEAQRADFLRAAAGLKSK